MKPKQKQQYFEIEKFMWSRFLFYTILFLGLITIGILGIIELTGNDFQIALTSCAIVLAIGAIGMIILLILLFDGYFKETERIYIKTK